MHNSAATQLYHLKLIEYGIDVKAMVKVVIKVLENGPNLVIVDGKTVAALCRCGASNDKPNCDGLHAKIGFKGKANEVKVLD